jgi:hypothetical protein
MYSPAIARMACRVYVAGQAAAKRVEIDDEHAVLAPEPLDELEVQTADRVHLPACAAVVEHAEFRVARRFEAVDENQALGPLPHCGDDGGHVVQRPLRLGTGALGAQRRKPVDQRRRQQLQPQRDDDHVGVGGG